MYSHEFVPLFLFFPPLFRIEPPRIQKPRRLVVVGGRQRTSEIQGREMATRKWIHTIDIPRRLKKIAISILITSHLYYCVDSLDKQHLFTSKTLPSSSSNQNSFSLALVWKRRNEQPSCLGGNDARESKVGDILPAMLQRILLLRHKKQRQKKGR